MITSAIVIEIHMRLQTSASSQVLSHLRAESNLLNAIGSTLGVEIDGGDVVSTVDVTRNSRRYFFCSPLARRTNFLGSLDGLSGLHTTLADEAL